MKYLINIYLVSLVFCMACGSDNAAEPLVLTSLDIDSEVRKLDLNASTTLTVTGKDQNGDDLEIDSDIVWSTNNANASVDQSGVVTGLLIGDVTITATVEEVSESVDIRVWDSSAPRTEIYVTDAARFANGGPYKVIRYDEDGGFAETLITSNLAWPQDIVFLEEDGIMLVSNLSSNKIEKFEISTGKHEGTFATVANGPTRMKIGSDNLLYVLQWNNTGAVLRYDLEGNFVDEFTSTGINQAIGMDWDSDGNFYVSSFGGLIKKFDSEGIDQGAFINSNLQGPTNVWITANDEMFVLDWTGGSVKEFGLDASFKGTVATGLARPEGIDRLPSGKFIIGNGGTSTLKVLSSSGAFEKDLFNSGFGGLSTPNGVIIRLVNQ